MFSELELMKISILNDDMLYLLPLLFYTAGFFFIAKKFRNFTFDEINFNRQTQFVKILGVKI